MNDTREELPFDILFIGGGPANLAGAIHLMNLAGEKGIELEVGLIEKGDEIGSHSLSGAILDPVALEELIPDYLAKGCPIETPQCRDEFYLLTRTRNFKAPITPAYMQNDGCCVISLSKFTRWLAELAESLGINIFPGFSGTEVIYHSDNQQIVGVVTGDKGIGKDKNKKSNFEPGVKLTAKVTVFGEGAKGSLAREVDRKLHLSSAKMPQIFETAIKEVIELPASSQFSSSPSSVVHTFGYPLGLHTKGGAFVYKIAKNRISLGLVVGLDYEDPSLEPYKAFIQLKRHPFVADIIAGGKVLQQGAKTLPAGGYYTIPTLAVDGALFVGDSASMLNPQRLKGIHTAMKSGMLAAETIILALEEDDFTRRTLGKYESKVKRSWIHREHYAARNFSQALSKKGLLKFVHLGVQYFTQGKGVKDPLSIKADHTTLKQMGNRKATNNRTPMANDYDNELYVDKLTGVYLSGTQHVEDQPCHLIVHDRDLCSTRCYHEYRNPCTRFCPAQVYEIFEEPNGGRRLNLNPANCLHCKTCEIKDPYNNITWTCPEGGGGPKYSIT